MCAVLREGAATIKNLGERLDSESRRDRLDRLAVFASQGAKI